MRSLVVIFLTNFVVRSSALCFPGESLTDCVRRQQEKDRTKQPLISSRSSQDNDENNQETRCLGVSVSDNKTFIGECKKSSRCADISSDSLNCSFSTVCCKKDIPCLGVSNKDDKDVKDDFIGECKMSSSCAEVSSESLNCPFSSVCCKKDIPCLGVSNKEGFFGECKKSSSCAEDSSESTKCLFSTVCCKKIITVRSPSIPEGRPREINDILPRQFEDVNQDNCGLRGPQNFVLGGEDVPEGALPFIVAFTHNLSPSQGWIGFCGGVLIAEDLVLTAAHCFDNIQIRELRNTRKFRVRLGVSDIARDQGSWEKNRTTVAQVKEVIKHPSYRNEVRGWANPFHDIALVKLDKVEGEKKYVCLPTYIREGVSESIVAGWGRTSSTSNSPTNVLKYAFLPISSGTQCQSSYDKLLANSDDQVYIGKNTICAGGNEVDTCRGDSGSPLLVSDTQSRWAVTGVVSFGASVCGSPIPGVFTKIQSYLPWIKREIEKQRRERFKRRN